MDIQYMKRALELSLKGLPSPNPYVGCVIIKDNKIIGEGYHKKYGQDHAEIVAIKDALKKGHNLENSTLYVTLEPCSHQGKTPPCVNKIIEHKISKVFTAQKDPNPKVNGNGIKKLNANKIKTSIGLLEKEVKKINEIYLKHITTKLPFITLKVATSLDGKIATKHYDSKWISNEKSRQYSRLQRSKYDAILVGINTVLKDNPHLTAKKEPLRIILDSKLKIPLNSNVLKDKNVMIATTEQYNKAKKQTLEEKGISTLICGKDKINLKYLTKLLGSKNISSILVEGGSKVATSFLKENLVDKLNLYIAPIILGNDAIPLIKDLNITKIQNSIKLKNTEIKQFDNNILLSGYLR